MSTRLILALSRLECEREGGFSLKGEWLELLRRRRELPDDDVGTESCCMAMMELCEVGKVGAA